MFPHHIVKRCLAVRENKAEAEDAALFRMSVGEVKPLSDQNRIVQQKPLRLRHTAAPPSVIPDTLSDGSMTISAADFTAGNAPDEFLRNGISRMALRRLRRCQLEDSLDLHGCNREKARKLLQEFLHEAARRGLRCVLVIHGKGTNSQGGEAVLRKLARHWLAQRPDVLAYCDALPREGGSGAALVMLKAIDASLKQHLVANQ